MSTTITTPKVRISYAHLFTPTAMKEGDTKMYSVALLIPKTDKAAIASIRKAIEEATEEGKSKKFNGKIPANLQNPLRDGDAEKPDNEEYEGMYFINVKNSKPPVIVDKGREAILDESKIYSGCYGRANITFFAYNYENMKKGISASINAFQKLEDGDRLGGGGVNIDEAFGDDSDDL